MLEARNETLEIRVKERTAELNAANENLRELSSRLLQLQDEERKRIARELHDSVGQLLVMMNMNYAVVSPELTKLTPKAMKAAEENAEIVREISRQVSTLSHLLHPPLLDEVGLNSALHWYIEEFGRRSNIQVTLNASRSMGRFSPEMETAIFRIVQECLTNVHRHSHSSTATVTLALRSDTFYLEVRDTGEGIPAEKQLAMKVSGRAGVGLRGMHERVGRLGGTLDIQSDKNGTGVIVSLPMKHAQNLGE